MTTGGNDRYDNLTPLYAAAEGGFTHIVETLLAAGADINAAAISDNNAQTPLQVAADRFHIGVIEKLFAAGADWAAVLGSSRQSEAVLQAVAGAATLEQ